MLARELLVFVAGGDGLLVLPSVFILLSGLELFFNGHSPGTSVSCKAPSCLPADDEILTPNLALLEL